MKPVGGGAGADTRATLRALLQSEYDRPVVSMFFDLDPAEFGTGPARDAQLASLMDQARRDAEGLEASDLVAEDLRRIESYVRGDGFPPADAAAVAMFSAGPDRFEILALTSRVQPGVVVDERPAVDRLPDYEGEPRWGVVLVNKQVGRFFAGPPTMLAERGVVTDRVHQKHSKGGWSQARYQRSVDEEVADHLRAVAGALERIDRRAPFVNIAIGGTAEGRAEFERHLAEPLRGRIAGTFEIDVENTGVDDVEERLAPIAEEAAVAAELGLLEQLAERLGREEKAVAGLDGVRSALAERRVEHVVCDVGWDPPGDVVTTAVEQAARITRLRRRSMGDTGPVAALLRF